MVKQEFTMKAIEVKQNNDDDDGFDALDIAGSDDDDCFAGADSDDSDDSDGGDDDKKDDADAKPKRAPAPEIKMEHGDYLMQRGPKMRFRVSGWFLRCASAYCKASDVQGVVGGNTREAQVRCGATCSPVLCVVSLCL